MTMIHTVGHGTATAAEFADLLVAAGVTAVVDIRRYPGSRRHPQFGRDEMARWLPARGLGYRWVQALGGRRRPTPDSPNTGLRNAQFRAYADHMVDDDFRTAVADLLAWAEEDSVVVMCAESVWWRCHRRLLADHLVVVDNVAVTHLFHDGRDDPHPVMPEASRDGDRLIYRPVQERG